MHNYLFTRMLCIKPPPKNMTKYLRISLNNVTKYAIPDIRGTESHGENGACFVFIEKVTERLKSKMYEEPKVR
ncbi:MAG: hypothetical protein JSW40_07980 [Candidatus Omnitrophota bacterium]|nr:MAG: hypothetical protein JSW40_07980 [Candidatus Omnitrophota bacterium]